VKDAGLGFAFGVVDAGLGFAFGVVDVVLGFVFGVVDAGGVRLTLLGAAPAARATRPARSRSRRVEATLWLRKGGPPITREAAGILVRSVI